MDTTTATGIGAKEPSAILGMKPTQDSTLGSVAACDSTSVTANAETIDASTSTATTTPTDPATEASTLAEPIVHKGSKRHPESKHGKGAPPKKQLKRVDLVTPEEDLKNAQYFFENDLRKIKPYFFKYQTYAKGRWLGRELIEVFNTEFRDRDSTFYERAIADGRVRVNGNIVGKEYIIKNSDIVSHDIHRHEPPVANLPVRVVRQDDGVIIVDKPSSIPVHPSGRYRHNTVLHILMQEQGFKELYPVNRLDRLTSGLMIMALSVRKAREFEQLMQKCEIKKEYICKVIGQFPSGITECHQPIHVASFKLTLNTVHPDGKACSTIFELLRYDPETDTSIVLARPVTGRTHQIRVHLQWLGYPITNDPLYQNKEIWGGLNGQGGITEEAEKELVQRFIERGELEDENDFALAESSKNASTDEGTSTSTSVLESLVASGAGFCGLCGLPSRVDPEPEKRIMFLHAWKYTAKDWAFETELPEWAKEASAIVQQKVLEATAVLAEKVSNGGP